LGGEVTGRASTNYCDSITSHFAKLNSEQVSEKKITSKAQ